MTNPRIFTVLYIEDDDANRQLVQLILARKEHLSLICAADGKSGLHAARTRTPDLILLDISLPDMDGYAVLAALKGDPLTTGIPVVAMSGDLPSESPQHNRFRFDKFMTKPIEIQSLYQTIDDFLQP